MQIKNLSVCSMNNILVEFIAKTEELGEGLFEDINVAKLNGDYFVDYSFRRPNGSILTHIGLEVEPLNLMEMLNDKLNRILETLNND